MQTPTEAPRSSAGSAFAALGAVAAEPPRERAELLAENAALRADLARLRRAQRGEQAESERLDDRLQRLLELLPAGVVVLDGRGRVDRCNPAAESMLGGAVAAGSLWREVAARAFAPRPDDGPELSLASGRRVSVSTRSLGSEPGQVVLLTDVTESRELREALARMQRRTAVGSLAATLAHQIRTPLAAALLHASGLRGARVDDEDRRHTAGRVVERLKHLERLVEDMLEFSRQGSFELEPVAGGELAEDIARGRGATLRGFRVESHDAVRDRAVAANRRTLASAVDNLVANAAEAGAASVLVEIAESDPFGRHAGGLRVTVSDDGPGMDESVRGRAFEPFFTTRGRCRGTGLGLAIVHAVIEAHGGDLQLHTAPGRGCRFVIELPAV